MERVAELEVLLSEIDGTGYLRAKLNGDETDLDGRVWRALNPNPQE